MELDTKTYLLTDRQSQYDFDFDLNWEFNQCEGGVEYLHRDPASRKRRRNGKSQIWDSKIWLRVSRYSDSRKTALTRASSMLYTRQTRPLLREGAPQKQDCNCQTVLDIWSGFDTKTYWLSDRQSQCDFDFDLNWEFNSVVQLWSVNQSTTEDEESPSLRFVTR
jgi:hypothetical protein